MINSSSNQINNKNTNHQYSYKNHQKNISFLSNLIIGTMSSTIAKTISSPLERVKLLLQNQEILNELHKKYNGNIDCFIRIFKEQGIKAYWRGNLANILRFVPNFSLTYALKELFRKISYKRNELSNNNKDLSSKGKVYINIITASLAGSISILFTHPFDFVRTKMGVSIIGKNEKLEYKGIIDCFYKTYKLHGLTGLYSGLTISILNNFFYLGLLFGLHDSIPKYSLMTSLFTSSLTSTFALTITFPFDTVKRRLMIQGKEKKIYRNLYNCFYIIYKNEGMRGYFKGGSANVVKSIGLGMTLNLNDYIANYFIKEWNFKYKYNNYKWYYS